MNQREGAFLICLALCVVAGCSLLLQPQEVNDGDLPDAGDGDTDSDIDGDSDVDVDGDTDGDTDGDGDADGDADVDADVDEDVDGDAEGDDDVDPDADEDPDTDIDPDIDIDPDTDTDTDRDSDPDTVVDCTVGSGLGARCTDQSRPCRDGSDCRCFPIGVSDSECYCVDACGDEDGCDDDSECLEFDPRIDGVCTIPCSADGVCPCDLACTIWAGGRFCIPPMFSL